jgi:cell division protease FtsH
LNEVLYYKSRTGVCAYDGSLPVEISSALGNVSYAGEGDEVFIGRSMAQAKPYSEQTAALIDREVKELLDAAYARSREILQRDRAQLELVARALLCLETLDAEQFRWVYEEPGRLEQQLGDMGADRPAAQP